MKLLAKSPDDGHICGILLRGMTSHPGIGDRGTKVAHNPKKLRRVPTGRIRRPFLLPSVTLGTAKNI